MNLDVLTLDRRSGALLATTIVTIAANALQVSQRVQASQLMEEPSKKGQEPSKKSEARNGAAKLATAVDANFARRLTTILQIIVPSWRSPEASILLAQTLALLCRTLLSLRIARCGGEGIKAVMHRSLSGFARCLIDFSLTGVVAGVVNSALKFHTNLLTVRFRTRLTKHVHERYCHGTRYYRAATLCSKGLDHLDQRVADDIHQFCATLADLHGRTFKPALDAVLCTHRMARSIGWKGLALLYGYYLSIGRRAAPARARAARARAAVLDGLLATPVPPAA
jgi:ATP-binding cassette subfamily D (ALD) protein 3